MRWIWILGLVLLLSCGSRDTAKSTVEVTELELGGDGRDYLNGEPYTGRAIERYSNGIIKYEAVIENGYIEGELKEWDSLGNILTVSNYRKGTMKGNFKKYYPNGDLHFEVDYADGAANGKAKEYHENGRIKIVSHYKDGVEHGDFILYDSSGIEQLKGMMVNGERDGVWFERWGKRRVKNTYEKGEILGESEILEE